MLKRILLLSAALLTLAIFPATRCAAKADADEAIVNHFFSAIRDGNFNAATEHFSTRMKGLSAAGLKGSWDQVYGNEGPMLPWKIFELQHPPKSNSQVPLQPRFRPPTPISLI